MGLVKASVYSRNLFNKGCRVPLRGKVNEAVHTGLRVVDTILPIGRGQRQLVIGDRFTGKTINCDVTEYIATNVISITDGQIYTNANLFKNGYRPAVDSAVSVSRVGSNAQFKYLKKLVGTIKNDLTNYRQ